MLNDDLHARIETIERDAERLAAEIESCRKAMLVSKATMSAGALALGGSLLGLLQLPAAGAVLSFGACIGGIVWYGSSHSTGARARETLAAMEAERSRAIDALDFRGGASVH